MPPRAKSREQRIRDLVKPVGLTLEQLKAEIDAADRFSRVLKLHRGRDFIRLIIRCTHPNPEQWAMAILLDNIRIDCIDYHTSDYRDHEGFLRLGWHRDIRENNRTIKKVALPDFKPSGPEQFIIDAMSILKVVLDPGGKDADSKL